MGNQAIQIDDKVKLKSGAKDYKKYKDYTWRVIETKFDNDLDCYVARIVRNFRNEKMGCTNCYVWEKFDNLKVVKKNKHYIEEQEAKQRIQDLDF